MMEIKNSMISAGEDSAVIFITGDIDENMLEQVQKDVEICKNAGIKNITFRVNSPGGSVSDGMGLYDLVSSLSDINTTAEIQGLAASAATYVVLACDHIMMHANSDFMIHEPEGGVAGTLDQVKKDTEYFATLRDRIIAIYCSKTGKSPAEIEKMLKDAKFLTAKQTLDAGFIDEIIGQIQQNEHDENPEEEKQEHEDDCEEKKSDDELEENQTNFFSFKNLIGILKANNISFIKAENDEFASQVEINNTLTEKVKNLESQLEAKQKSYDEIVNRLEEQKKDIDKQIQIAVANKIASMGYTDELPLPEKSKKMTDNEFRNALIEVYRKQGYEAAAKFTKSREEGEI